jgi:outer membrane protein assembly factor BamD (BamD/ComL family)
MIKERIRETSMNMSCPTCNRELADALVCKCGTDLSLLQNILARADHLYNQAIEAYQDGKNQRALEYLEANAVLVPFDIEARIFQAKLMVIFERWQDAREIVKHIQATMLTHSELAMLNRMLFQNI